LTGIIDGQRKRLVELFKTIHAPQEFDGVKFNGDIYLNRRGGGASRLSEISTGQRSALALSIFLSMNSSVGKMAPWLIFDDPIAHIDDLNVLSFLDSLRELVTNGDRQMFFATANSKVANLFARKFDFLGDSFREIALDRAES
jgi:exonuclease SbcC